MGHVGRYSLISIIAVTFLLFQLTYIAEGADTLQRVEASFGLPQETESFSTVESYDSDGNGKDEIYLGCAGFEGNVISEGIQAYEYDPDSGQWEPFGSGLPGEGSGVNYGGLGLGDVNNDGEMDIVSPVPSRWYLYKQNGLEIYTGDGNGNFQFFHRVPLVDGIPGSSNEVEVADMDGDGFNDLVASTYSGVKVFFGDGSGTRWTENSPTAVRTVEISGVGIGDIDGDGLLDVVGTPGQGSSEVEVYIQGNLRTWRDVPFVEIDAGYGVKVRDVDLDGDDDIVYGTGSEGIKVWLCEGSVSLTSVPGSDGSSGLPDSGGDWDQIELADINGDDLPDMIAAINSESLIHCFINDLPNGWIEVFTGDQELFVGGYAYGANFGDWDGDGQLDLGGCSWDHGADAWLIPTAGGDSPSADAGNDRTMDLGDMVTLDGSGSSDPDGDIITWEWTCTSHNDVDLENGNSATPTFTPDEEGTYLFNLRIMDDDDQWSQISTVRITVIDPDRNNAPVADAGMTVHDVYVGDEVSLDGSGSSDIDGDIAEWKWTCTSHSIDIQDDDTAFPSFTPDDDGDYTLKLEVTDDDGDSDTDQVTIHVEYHKFGPRIGPITYEDDNPIPAATVTLEGNGIKKTSVTNDEGYAQFSIAFIEGDYTCTVELEGEVILGPFGITISDSGKVSYKDGAIPNVPNEEKGDNSMMILIGIGLAIVVVIIVGVLVISNRRRTDEPVQQVEVQAYGCETCGDQLRYMDDFNMYYCDTCQKYAGQ